MIEPPVPLFGCTVRGRDNERRALNDYMQMEQSAHAVYDRLMSVAYEKYEEIRKPAADQFMQDKLSLCEYDTVERFARQKFDQARTEAYNDYESKRQLASHYYKVRIENLRKKKL